MSSKNPRNRTPGDPVATANIRAPHGAYTRTTITQPEEDTHSTRLASRAGHRRSAAGDPDAIVRAHLAELENSQDREYIEEHGRTAEDSRADVVDRPPRSLVHAVPPPIGTLTRLTRNDVEVFFEASHAFRVSLAGVLPEIARKIGRFVLAVPYTITDAVGRPLQMLPDVDAMTAAQVKLAGIVLNRLLPPIADMDIEGKPGPGKGTMIDARHVRITVNQVSGDSGAGDATDARLRTGAGVSEHDHDGRKHHPNAARQVAPVTVSLGQMVERAQARSSEHDPDAIPSPRAEQDTLLTVQVRDDE